VQQLISDNLTSAPSGIGFIPVAKPFNSVERVVVIVDPDPSIERSGKQMGNVAGSLRMQLIQQTVSSDFATPSSDRAFISRMPGRAQSRLCGSPLR
jgi:hypothetical protein